MVKKNKKIYHSAIGCCNTLWLAENGLSIWFIKEDIVENWHTQPVVTILKIEQIYHYDRRLQISYFCRHYCSADKGSVENRNKILRQFLPKKTNFDLISQHQIDIIRNKINNRPMKVLNWNTPCSLFFSS